MNSENNFQEVDEAEINKKIIAGKLQPVHLPKIVTINDIVKYQFCTDIIRFAKTKKLKQTDIAAMIDLDKAEVSKLFAYNLKAFSQERIMGFIQNLISKGAEINLTNSWDKISVQTAKLSKKIKTKQSEEEEIQVKSFAL